ncbi:MAG TPA: biotin/lipoyl-binding carrier protein [Burkholderiaceae bacterium]|jgi:acetyl-CoA carboxylase biotin carboxyl carrier protein|nr:biotin/lipoyl-binding carrier protein [Burkholderiaceae bacterium]
MARVQVLSEVSGSVWKIEAASGTQVGADDTILIIESMKMEIPVASPRAGRVVEIRVAEGDPVKEGQVVAVIE